MHACAVYQADIWKDGRNIGGEFVFGIRDEDTPGDERLANARFAVLAVNSHAALVEACELALDTMRLDYETVELSDLPSTERNRVDKVFEQLRAALTLAKEQS